MRWRVNRSQPTAADVRQVLFGESPERVRARAGQGTWSDFYELAMTGAGDWSTVVTMATDFDPRRMRYSQHRKVETDTSGVLAAVLCAWIVAGEPVDLLTDALHVGFSADELGRHLDGNGRLDAATVSMLLALQASSRS